MNNKKFDVLIADIDSSFTTPLELLIEKTETSTNFYDEATITKKFFPSQISCLQNSGVDIEFLFLTEQEYPLYVATPTDFEFFKVPNLIYLQNDALPRSKYCVIKAITAGASKDLRIDFLNYVQYSEVRS